MKKRQKLPLIILIITVLVALIAVIPFSRRFVHALKNHLQSVATSISMPQPTTGSTILQGGPLISRNVPAFASSGSSPASDANDNSYDTTWRSQGAPAWLAYDLSSVPTARRSQVVVAWYNGTGSYDHTIIGYPAYNLPQDYTIEANAAAGGGNPPATGWVNLVTVRGNHYHSRQHVVTMKGYNWLRINITKIDGAIENYDASINMDIYDASTALTDDWIFFGDSITAGAMGLASLNGVLSFPQIINAQIPNKYPLQEGGGTGYLTSSDGAKYLNTWLGLFPGKYVGLSYGTNDAIDCVNPDTFYKNYVTMVEDVLHAGKIPLVPYIPWGRHSNIQQCGPTLNTQIDKLYSAFPQIIHGPDLWSFFQSHPDLISSDNIHPTDDGFGAYRQQWAETMLAEIYRKS
jgi:lysophospholipase L1-like esterase